MRIECWRRENDFFELLLKFKTNDDEEIKEWFDIEDIDVLIRELNLCKQYIMLKLEPL